MGFFYLRVLIEDWQKLIRYCMMTLSTLANICDFIYLFIACNVSEINRGRVPALCTSKGSNAANLYLQGAVNVLFDVVFIIQPLPGVIKAQWDTMVKLSVIFNLCLGMMYNPSVIQIRFTY
jgi:hypothetical protein